MSRRRNKTKYLRQQQDVAAVEVTLIEDETGWSPYLSLEDAEKLDQVREVLRQVLISTWIGELKSAIKSHFGNHYSCFRGSQYFY